MSIYQSNILFSISTLLNVFFFSAYYLGHSRRKKKWKGNTCSLLKKWPIIWGHNHVYLSKKLVWPDAWWEMERCYWGTGQGAVLKTQPQGPGSSTYREDSLTWHSFHFMAQTPDHRLYLTNHRVFARPRKPSPQRPHSSFLHSVTEMWCGIRQY